jgi:hypothetical protein
VHSSLRPTRSCTSRARCPAPTNSAIDRAGNQRWLQQVGVCDLRSTRAGRDFYDLTTSGGRHSRSWRYCPPARSVQPPVWLRHKLTRPKTSPSRGASSPRPVTPAVLGPPLATPARFTTSATWWTKVIARPTYSRRRSTASTGSSRSMPQGAANIRKTPPPMSTTSNWQPIGVTGRRSSSKQGRGRQSHRSLRGPSARRHVGVELGVTYLLQRPVTRRFEVSRRIVPRRRSGHHRGAFGRTAELSAK